MSCDQLPAMSLIARADTWQEAIGQILKSLGKVEAVYSLGLIYISRQFIQNISDIEILLRQTTGVKNWVGAVGFGVCGTNIEYHDNGAISILLLPFDKSSYHIFRDISDDINLANYKMKPWLKKSRVPIILAHIDPINSSITKLIGHMSKITNGYLIGGICAAQGRKSQLAAGTTGWGLSGVMFDSAKINSQISMFQHCNPISAPHMVTTNIDNVIIELDNQPALNIFKHDIGELLARNLENTTGYIFAAIPIPASTSNDYMIRDIIGIDQENNALAIANYPPDNKNLIFCRKDHDQAIENLYTMLNNLKARIGIKTIRAGIYISSTRSNFEQPAAYKSETQMITEILGEFPMTGFFTNGEIYHDRIYNHTGILTLFV